MHLFFYHTSDAQRVSGVEEVISLLYAYPQARQSPFKVVDAAPVRANTNNGTLVEINAIAELRQLL
jgi:hypothetical protein